MKSYRRILRSNRLTSLAASASWAIVLLAVATFGPSPATAFVGGPQWTVAAVSRPTNFRPGDESGKDVYIVTVTNTGGTASDGSNVVITDELPEGLALAEETASGEDQLNHAHPNAGFSCVLKTCIYTGVVVPDDTLVLTFPVNVTASGSWSVTNLIHVSGGGAPDAAMATPTTISESNASFGISPGGATTTLSTTQAGAHPDLTTTIAFNTVTRSGSLAGDPKETTDQLPTGFAGDLLDMPSCLLSDFTLKKCPINTQIGVTTLTTDLFGEGKLTLTDPVYNLSPNPGELAKIGFFAATGLPVEGEVRLRPSDYGLEAAFHNVNETPAELDNVSLTIWGVPSDPSHDPLRWVAEGELGHFGASSTDALAVPFLTNPTMCGGSLQAVFSSTSWQQVSAAPTKMNFGPIVGCDRLALEPSLVAEATTTNAYSPTGLNVEITVPQTYDNAHGLAAANVKGTIVTLPEGVTVNPSAGAGLAACTQTEYEAEPVQVTPGVGCPSESKLGTVDIVTPALREHVKGTVYLAQPYANPFHSPEHPAGSLLAIYIVARVPDRGVIVKVAGEVSADPFTGQLVTTFDNLPPLPFSSLAFRFNQGATSPLVTPAACGSYGVKVSMVSWANPGGSPLMPLIPPFPISKGVDGGACPTGGVPPLAPEVIAGTESNTAASYSPFYLRIVRHDGEQELTGFSTALPAGLTAKITGVPYCSESDVALSKVKSGEQEEREPSCPAQSQIGHTLVGAGVGSVLVYASGKIYLGGPFEGAPFSVIAVTSAKVGPFDLGTVVVHLPIRIDRDTARVSVVAGGADQIPHIIRGIVVHVRDIRVYVDRPGFVLNPTSCDRMKFEATVIGSGHSFTSPLDDVAVTKTDPFQAADCEGLDFAPSLKVSTTAKTSRLLGASLTAVLKYPKTKQGRQANIRSVKVNLPRQLPSRLSTLQRACPDEKFEADPATCPSESRVGRAIARTPILPVPLVGPAYFVSHGGARFPELIVVLQGDGVTVDLHGETFISRSGVTSSTFRTVPDQPVSEFELSLPQGRFSALAGLGDLCKTKLKMPTAFTAQNGKVLRVSTPIRVTGCSKHKVKAK